MPTFAVPDELVYATFTFSVIHPLFDFDPPDKCESPVCLGLHNTAREAIGGRKPRG